MHATTCVSIKPSLLANHVRVFCTPLIQALNAHVLHTSMCYTRPFVVYTTDTSYERQWATDAMCPVHHWCNVRASVWYTCRCADTSCVRVLQMSVCCVHYLQATHVRRRSCVGQSCEPLIQATSPSVLFTTVTSYTRSRNFLIHFLNYIRDLHILQASFSICACDLNKTDELRELAMDWQRF